MPHIAQVNIGRIAAPLESPVMTGFVNRLAEINALADGRPGFLWRLQVDGGNATYIRPFEDDRMLINMSVWETLEALRNFVYQTVHVEMIRERHLWFEALRSPYLALWWVQEGHIPDVEEAKQRLAHLEAHGPSAFAFTFRNVFYPDPAAQRAAV
jgi:hypothetical protein